jgi:hypothetical protein
MTTESEPETTTPTPEAPAEVAAPVEVAETPRATDGRFAPKPPTLDELLSRPDIAAELAKQTKLAAKKAVDEARDAAAQAAERAKMDEVGRLKAEKADAEAKLAATTERAASAERERDLSNALVTSGVRLVDEKSLDFVRFQAAKIADAEEIPMATAVTRVLGEHKYLIAPATSATPEPVATPVERPSTAPPTKPTQTPSAAKPEEGVDVMSMTRTEYEQYKRSQHGFH